MLFAEIPGQEPTKARLLKSLREKRISHAQLFLGETGAGSLALVLAYAQYVNCHNPTENDSCGECQSCRKTKALEHPDVYYTYPVIPFKSGTPPKSLDYFKEWKMALQANPFMEYNDWMNYIEAENKQGNITADECREIIKHLSLMPVYEGYKIQIIWLPERLGKEGNILLKILEEP
ncbi:MAG: hypothetical protein NTX03_13825, partial [Bacteroidetes bacterium]|nr:hypothetical protein [Bacteroidota bacterium]